MECLLKVGVDLVAQRESVASAFFYASQNGHPAIASALLQYGANPNIPMKDGRTALMIASFNGDLEVVECLLKVGVDLDAQRKVVQHQFLMLVGTDTQQLPLLSSSKEQTLTYLRRIVAHLL